MKRIVSLLMIGLMLNSTFTTSCGAKRLSTAHFFDDSDSDAGIEADTETDGTIDAPSRVDVVEEPGYGVRSKGEKVETHDFGTEPTVTEVDSNKNERGDAGQLTSDGKVTTKSSGISSVTENQTADTVADEKKNAQPSGGQGQDTRAEQDSLPFGPADPSNGSLTNRRSDGCINCGGSEFAGIAGSGMVKTNTYSSIDDLKTANTKEFDRLKEHIRPASEGGAEKRQRLSGHSENLRIQHNETVARLKAKFAAENAKFGSKVRFKTSEKSAIGRDIRDVATRFENTSNQTLKNTGNDLLNAADRAAYLGKLTSSSAFTAEAKRLSQAAESGSLPLEVFDPNHRPDYNPGNFDERNEKIKAGRIAIDLYNAASELAKEKSPAAAAALGDASLLLDVALGVARFSTIVDVPLSAMELFTGKTLEFDANGNPIIVEASTVTRAAAALTLGLTAAAFVTTGGLAAVSVAAAMGFIPGLMKAARRALGGLSKTEKTTETVADVERTVEKIVDSAENIGLKKAEEIEKVFLDLASSKRRTHILNGDATGGGHMFPGRPGKSVFPQSWDGDKIMNEVSDIATDPGVQWEKNRTVRGLERFKAKGTRDGVEIEVIIEPNGENIVSAFPVSGPGVIRNP